MTDKDIIKAALADYAQGEMTTKEIAARSGVSKSAITVWAAKAGLKLRPRGRRKMQAPTARQREILKFAGVCSYQYLGKRFGMTKQGVHRIVKRWKRPPAPPRARFEARAFNEPRRGHLTALPAAMPTGNVVEATGQTSGHLIWSTTGDAPKSVGTN